MLMTKKNKKGEFGMQKASAFIGAILGVVLLAFVVVIIIATLNSTTILTANSAEKNATTYMFNNFTNGLQVFFSYIPTWFLILAIAVLIVILILLVAGALYIARAAGGVGGRGGGVGL